MAKTRYVPPVQGKFGMIADSLFLLLLVYGALLAPLLFDFSGGGEAEQTIVQAETVPTTWESLGQNPVMQQQWEKLGVPLEDAEAIINDKFDYTIRPLSLITIIAIIIGYFFFLLKISDREYRQVISEKFDD